MAANSNSTAVATNSRSQSLLSQMADDEFYALADSNRLYEAVLKAVVMEYICEARFYKPIQERFNTRNSEVRKSRLSKSETILLPSYLLGDLKNALNGIAMKKTSQDELTRRSLLRFYGELLDPSIVAEIRKADSVDMLVMKFVACANKELVKVNLVAPENISSVVMNQSKQFIQLIISLVPKDRELAVLVAKLNEHKEALHTKRSNSPTKATSMPESTSYPKPSFKLSDMDKASLGLLQDLFLVHPNTLQNDVNRLLSFITQKALHKDLEQVSFYLKKDLGQFPPLAFKTLGGYEKWKQRESTLCEQLIAKYPVPPPQKLLSVPALPQGEDFYVMPPSVLSRLFYITLCKLCLEKHRLSLNLGFEVPADVTLFTNKMQDLLHLCGRLWRIDVTSRAVCLFASAHLANLMVDPLFVSESALGPIELNTATRVFNSCKKIVEDAGLRWETRSDWPNSAETQWVNFLGYTYSDVFHSIKDLLEMILSKNAKPKFAPFLHFLYTYVESDASFPELMKTKVAAKWERRLTRCMLRVSESLYVEIMARLPRDDTLSLVHVLAIADALVNQIKLLQKKYKNPLLGYLNVSRTYAAVVTGMFALDARNILKHINAHSKARNEFLNYSDVLDIYRSLKELRFIHRQASPESLFKFNLEKFAFPYLEAWMDESNEKIREYVHKAIEEDKFEPVNIEEDDKKFSSSVHDIFTLIKHYISILLGLEWENEYELAKVYTSLIVSISANCIQYSSVMADMVMKDLAEEESQENAQPQAQGFLAEMKSIVSNISSLAANPGRHEVVNFTPRTCIGVNNIHAMSRQLAKMEELLAPEEVSQMIIKHNPASRHSYTSHVFAIRVVKAESLSLSSDSSLKPYLTLVDSHAKRTVAKTRTLEGDNPEWDEEFEITVPANNILTLHTTVWQEKFGTHGVFGRALMQLEPRKFKHDGIPQEIFLDLDPQGRVLVEVAVESERNDAIFALGRAHRALKRGQQRITKLIVAKFAQFIKQCFSRQTLRSVCGASGNVKPTQEQMDEAMMPLCNYLNLNLLVLAQFLSKDLLFQVMEEAWAVVVASADELLLPKLKSSGGVRGSIARKSATPVKTGWQTAVTSAVANVTQQFNNLGFGKKLTNTEIETVIAWLNFLCIDFFHNKGHGPALEDLKTEKYQSLLLIPVYYDQDVKFLESEVDRLSPAYLQTLRDKNNLYSLNHPSESAAMLRSRAGSIARSLTIRANATARARAQAAKEAKEMLADPLMAQTSTENIILRLLLIKDANQFVARRMDQRERLAHTVATERLARAAAEGTLH